MLTKGNWYLFEQFNEMNIVAYLNILSFEMMKRDERNKRAEMFILRNKTKDGVNPQAYSVYLLEEILKCL